MLRGQTIVDAIQCGMGPFEAAMGDKLAQACGVSKSELVEKLERLIDVAGRYEGIVAERDKFKGYHATEMEKLDIARKIIEGFSKVVADALD